MWQRITILMFSLSMAGGLRAERFDEMLAPAENQLWMEALQSQIRPGLRRADVEKLLPERAMGIQALALTRYRQEPGYIIDVPYDQSGGSWNDNNRVCGPIVIEPRSHP